MDNSLKLLAARFTKVSKEKPQLVNAYLEKLKNKGEVTSFSSIATKPLPLKKVKKKVVVKKPILKPDLQKKIGTVKIKKLNVVPKVIPKVVVSKKVIPKKIVETPAEDSQIENISKKIKESMNKPLPKSTVLKRDSKGPSVIRKDVKV